MLASVVGVATRTPTMWRRRSSRGPGRLWSGALDANDTRPGAPDIGLGTAPPPLLPAWTGRTFVPSEVRPRWERRAQISAAK